MTAVLPGFPPSVEILERTLVKPKSGSQGAEGGTTPLTCFDTFVVTACSARAWGFRGASIDAGTLQEALQATVTDMPVLAGRLRRLDEASVGTLYVDHTGEGAQLTVAECLELTLADALSPENWAERGFTVGKATVPLYLDYMDVEGGYPASMMEGKVPLLMVRLTRVRDGCILGICVSHTLKDGMHWPKLTSHLAARYRQFADGTAPDPADLLQPTSRLVLSSKGMAAELGVADSWQPPPNPVHVSLRGKWRCFKYILSHVSERRELVFLHLPQHQVAELKRLAAEGCPDGMIVTTGDAVQAAAAMLQHAAMGLPLLPRPPRGVALMLQNKVPAGFFGNAVGSTTAIPTSAQPRPADEDYAGTLQQLACAIRRATVAFRSEVEQRLALTHEFECMVHSPQNRLLGYWCGERVPLMTCWTNYVPKQRDPDFGVGVPAYDRELTSPRTRDMVVIRAANAVPYSEGLFMQLCLTPRQAARLRAHPVQRGLMPGASWLGRGT